MEKTIKYKIINNIVIATIIGFICLIFFINIFIESNTKNIIENEMGIVISYIRAEVKSNYLMGKGRDILDIENISEDLDVKLLFADEKNNLENFKINEKVKYYVLEEFSANTDKENVVDLIIFKNYTELYENNKKIIDIVIVLGLIFVIILIFVIYCIVITFTKPIEEITNDLKQFGIGEEVKGREYYNYEETEVVELADNFYIMRDNILKLKDINNEFFNKVTHELKTPITAIRGYSQILQGKVSSEDIQAMKRIEEESKKMNKLVENILLISREDSNVVYMKESIYLNDIIDNIIESFNFKVEIDEYEMNYSYDDEYYIKANKDDVYTVLVNLIENAFKYSYDKKIDIKIDLDATSKIRICVKNKVCDVGKLYEKNLFDAFVKENGINNGISSSGLGLYIVKKTIERNEWDIEYKFIDNEICFIVNFGVM